MRALPLQKFRRAPSCWETTATRRCSARWPGESPSAQTPARRRWTARRATSPRPSAAARRPSCRPTTPPRRRHAARHCRSSAAWRRSRRACASPAASISMTLPSSPPVTSRLPSDAARENAAAMQRRRGARSPSAATSSACSSLPTKATVSPRKCTAITGMPAAMGFTRSATETISRRVRERHHANRVRSITPRCNAQTRRGSSSRAIRGR